MILFVLPIAIIMRVMREFWWVFVLLLLVSWLSGCAGCPGGHLSCNIN